MQITQGTFSYLPPLTDEQITAQIQYSIDNSWSVQVEFTDDPTRATCTGTCGDCPCSSSRTPPAHSTR
jgi:Ribulose bisphosphate carboxylase small subunit